MNHPIYRITSCEHIAPYSLRLRFNDGLARTIDFESILEGELYGRLRDPMPLAALTVLVFTFDRREQALAAGFWRCVEIIAGVAIGLALMAIPFRASEPGPGRRVARGAACWRRQRT